MIRVIYVFDDYGCVRWKLNQTVATMEYPPIGKWHVAAVQMLDVATGAMVEAFGGGA